MKSITIAYPSRGLVPSEWAINLRYLEVPEGWGLECLDTIGCFIDSMRNSLVEASKGDYILFLDDDVCPPLGVISQLLKHKKDIVTGLYFAKQRPHFPQIFKRTKEDRYDTIADYPENKLIEIDACGVGCLLVKKSVFEKLNKPYFKYVIEEEGRPRKGEDYYFCENIKRNGFKIYCDTSVICTHIGTQYIGPEHWKISLEQLKKLENSMSPEEWEKFKKNIRNIS